MLSMGFIRRYSDGMSLEFWTIDCILLAVLFSGCQIDATILCQHIELFTSKQSS